MLAALGIVLIVIFMAAGAWLIAGPVGQRGRAIRAANNGRPNGTAKAALAIAALLIVILIVLHL